MSGKTRKTNLDNAKGSTNDQDRRTFRAIQSARSEETVDVFPSKAKQNQPQFTVKPKSVKAHSRVRSEGQAANILPKDGQLSRLPSKSVPKSLTLPKPSTVPVSKAKTSDAVKSPLEKLSPREGKSQLPVIKKRRAGDSASRPEGPLSAIRSTLMHVESQSSMMSFASNAATVNSPLNTPSSNCDTLSESCSDVFSSPEKEVTSSVTEVELLTGTLCSSASNEENAVLPLAGRDPCIPFLAKNTDSPESVEDAASNGRSQEVVRQGVVFYDSLVTNMAWMSVEQKSTPELMTGEKCHKN